MTARARILVVEDESLIALDISRRLPKLGYEVCAVVASGRDAISKAIELKPDLILMDICLRGEVDGIEAAKAIRQQSDIPVVFLTANSDEKTLDRAKSARPSSYLLKPFKERELQIGVDMALLNHGLQLELNTTREQLEQRVAERTSELARTNAALRTEVEVRKKMEMQTREQADLLDKAQDAIYVRDLAGSISFWNHSAERLYGYPEGEAIGRHVRILLKENGDRTASEAERLSILSGEWHGELHHRTRTGQELIVESRWTLVRDEAGTPTKILIVNTDITERKRTAENFLRTQRLESVGALVAGITHDLNNVFSPIVMMTDLLIAAPEAQRIQMVEMTKVAANRGSNMVKQLLMFVRGGTNEMKATDVSPLAQEVRRLMEKTLPCSIKIIAHVPTKPALVLGDATQLHQVLVNLCVNARDAMPNGGELCIKVEEVTIDETTARGKPGMKSGQHVCLVVSDSGTGMSSETAARIFEPFFTTKEIGKGTGLGLSSVASIVRSHQGAIDVETTVGNGTRFLIYLPTCKPANPANGSNPQFLITGHNELVIVADDDHSVREITKITLEAHGYRVLVADNGAQALSIYGQHRDEVALIVTDIMMPVMNGRELIYELHKLCPAMPVVVFSASEQSIPVVENFARKNVSLLRKPASSARLLAEVAAALHPVDSAKKTASTHVLLKGIVHN